MTVLFKECVTALGANTVILTEQQSTDLVKTFSSVFPITAWGRIDWDKIHKKVVIDRDSPEQIITSLQNLLQEPLDFSIYILWDDQKIPLIKTDLKQAVICIEFIECVDAKAWIFNPAAGYVIEWILGSAKVVGVLS